MGYAERVLQPDETIVYRARLHWVIYLSGLALMVLALALAMGSRFTEIANLRIGLLILALIAVIMGAFRMLGAWFYRVNTEIIVTNRRIIYKTGFISRKTLEMNLNKVESVLVDQSILGRMLNYGAVVIRGVGAGLEPVRNIAAPLELHRHVGAAE